MNKTSGPVFKTLTVWKQTGISMHKCKIVC